MLVKYEDEELCESCAVTEYLDEVWAEGEADKGELEAIIKSANVLRRSEIGGTILEYKRPAPPTLAEEHRPERPTDSVSRQQPAEAPKASHKTLPSWLRRAFRLIVRALDVSSDYIADVLRAGADIFERIWSGIDEILGEFMLVALLVSFVIGLVWLVKWLWVHLPV